ncbi:hypothetical protein ABZX92_27630 [Lentzea sp. NPDC006480]|uniref:hypothetical protein n=1 Tax=Lentzea sp. NPDC006480 TaxID=3157176 RepID=UPI0033BA8A56
MKRPETINYHHRAPAAVGTPDQMRPTPGFVNRGAGRVPPAPTRPCPAHARAAAAARLLLARPATFQGDPQWMVHGRWPDIREWNNGGKSPSFVQGVQPPGGKLHVRELDRVVTTALG